MKKQVFRWFSIYDNEIGVFVWSASLLFLIRSSDLLLNNFAETAFLKRFGVQYLPLIYVANSLTTFFILGLLTGLIARYSSDRILSRALVVFGFTAVMIRLVIPLGLNLIYPALFIVKSLFEVLLGMFFWNLANDLFDTRQSKRLFPLISAGGVLGDITGSFMTPVIARNMFLDNMLLGYCVIAFGAAFLVKQMRTRFPSSLTLPAEVKQKAKRKSIVEEIKTLIPLMRSSSLVKILIILTLVPNIVLPLLNYLFNYTIDAQFATESGMIAFFGYFKGMMNIVSLFLLLFVGKIYGRWGLSVALLFHPFNYALVFIAFLVRFDIWSAVYARMSTNIIRTTFNKPATDVLMGLFPVSYRSIIRPFLRGTAVRLGLLIGSGIIIGFEYFFHPRYLSLVAIPIILVWFATVVYFKGKYSKILSELVSQDILDLKSLEPDDISGIFKDKATQALFFEQMTTVDSTQCLWYARLLHELSSGGSKQLDRTIFAVIDSQEKDVQIELIGLLSSTADPQMMDKFEQMARIKDPELAKALVKASFRFETKYSLPFLKKVLNSNIDLQVNAYAVGGMSRHHSREYRPIITAWIKSTNMEEKKAGIIAAGRSGDLHFFSPLKQMISEQAPKELIPSLIDAVALLETGQLNDLINDLVAPFLKDEHEDIRMAALVSFDIYDESSLKKVIDMMSDSSFAISKQAKDKIWASTYHNSQVLIASLTHPKRAVRDGILDLIKRMGIKQIETMRFFKTQLEAGYNYLVLARAFEWKIKKENKGAALGLLVDHCIQQSLSCAGNVLDVLAVQDKSNRLRLATKGVFSNDPRNRANSQEILDDMLDNSLSRILLPLIDNSPLSERIRAGRKYFNLVRFAPDTDDIFTYTLQQTDWVGVVLTLSVFRTQGWHQFNQRPIAEYLADDFTCSVPLLHRCVEVPAKSDIMDLESVQKKTLIKEKVVSELSIIPDKIILLKGIEIFEELDVGELAAIAAVAQEVDCPGGSIVINENEPGETMYLIIDGQVTVIKQQEDGKSIELDTMGQGDYFGEMALFEDIKRTATIRCDEQSKFLVLHKHEFTEIVREYPQIALHICKIFSKRLRRLHKKFLS